jgi:hypothetical protein
MPGQAHFQPEKYQTASHFQEQAPFPELLVNDQFEYLVKISCLQAKKFNALSDCSESTGRRSSGTFL